MAIIYCTCCHMPAKVSVISFDDLQSESESSVSEVGWKLASRCGDKTRAMLCFTMFLKLLQNTWEWTCFHAAWVVGRMIIHDQHIYILHIHTVQYTSFVFSMYELLLIVTLFPKKVIRRRLRLLLCFWYFVWWTLLDHTWRFQVLLHTTLTSASCWWQ